MRRMRAHTSIHAVDARQSGPHNYGRTRRTGASREAATRPGFASTGASDVEKPVRHRVGDQNGTNAHVLMCEEIV